MTEVKDVPKWRDDRGQGRAQMDFISAPRSEDMLSSEHDVQPGEEEGMPAKEGCLGSPGTTIF